MEASLQALIEEAYGPAEVKRREGLEISRAELDLAAQAGQAVLARSLSKACSCAHLSALWTAIVRDDLGLPAYAVTGDLRVRGRMAFGSPDPAVARSLGESNEAWDAHCWLSLGPYIGDASIFRTAYAQPPNSNLRQAVVAKFGLGRGLLLMTSQQAAREGFEYIPKYVVRDDEITGLVRGAVALGLLEQRDAL